MDLDGAVVLVTGASRGLGEAFVAELRDRGVAKIYAGARNPGAVATPGVVAVALDITDPGDVERAAVECRDVTVVINNAGISTGTSLLTGSLDDARAEFDTNVFGTLAVTRAFAPVLAANGGGALINVLSVLSWISIPATGAYCAAKAAALSMTNSIRLELAAQGTQVLAVHVGYIDTDMAAAVDAPKNDPHAVAATVLDGLVAGAEEVLVDDLSRNVKASLSGPTAGSEPDSESPAVTSGAPRLVDDPGAVPSGFVASAGLVVDEATSTLVRGHIDIDDTHHTPWGIVHGGVYSTAVESAASIGASGAVRERDMVAVGLTNTTQFLRSITKGRVAVEAHALNQGRTQQLWQVDVRDDRDRLLAHGEVRLQNLAAS
jgi:uncharacterized protein (TIGR00369 family)